MSPGLIEEPLNGLSGHILDCTGLNFSYDDQISVLSGYETQRQLSTALTQRASTPTTSQPHYLLPATYLKKAQSRLRGTRPSTPRRARLEDLDTDVGSRETAKPRAPTPTALRLSGLYYRT